MYFFYFYPSGLDIQLRRTPVMTYSLILFMSVVFLWQRYFPYALPVNPWRFVFAPGNGNAWTVMAAVFLHGGWLHLIGNMVYLYTFGPAIEDRLGGARLLYFFVVTGAWGNMVHGLLGMHGYLGSSLGVLGASGGIAGLLGIALVRFSFARVAMAYWVFAPLQGMNRVGRKHLVVPVAIALWLLLQVVHGAVAGVAGSAVSYGAHFGGFGLGIFLALILKYRTDARSDACLRRGGDFLSRGESFAAEGEFLQYLDMRPDDLQARLQLARSRRLGGRKDEAVADYRRIFRGLVDAGDIDGALEVFRETERGQEEALLPPEELAEAAFLLEKQLDFEGAVETYVGLWRRNSGHEKAELALVRAVVLLHSRIEDGPLACRLLEEAGRDLGPGVWRDFLEDEFNLRRASGAGARAGQPVHLSPPAV